MPLAVFSTSPAPRAQPQPQPQPASLTAAAGMNALVLAIEAYVSTTATPMADACALKAVALTGRWLRQAVADGGDTEAHEQIACARFLADLAFESASRAGAQAQMQALAMTHRPGGPHDLPHAQARRRQLTARRLAEIARAMGEPVDGLDTAAAADLCLTAVYRLSAEIGCSGGRASAGAPYPHPAAAPAHALPDLPGLALHPEPVSQEEIQALFPGAA